MSCAGAGRSKVKIRFNFRFVISTTAIVQNGKYYFYTGNCSVLNGSCAEMKAEYLRMVA
jgi:hypothetical protein